MFENRSAACIQQFLVCVRELGKVLKLFMGKHFHLIGHFLKNAQSSENMYEIFFGPLKNAQLSENACPYPRASILT